MIISKNALEHTTRPDHSASGSRPGQGQRRTLSKSPLIAVVLAGLIGVGAFYLGQRWATQVPQNVRYTVDNGRIVPMPEPVGFSRKDL